MSEDGANFLANLYDPPLRRFPRQGAKAHLRGKAAAWGAALEEWLAGCEKKKTRACYTQAVASLWNWSRKLPWEVHPRDVADWLEEGLEGKTAHTKANLLRWARLFYRMACEKTWTSPAGRKLRLCRIDPTEGVQRPKAPWFPKTEPLSEAEIARLLAAFDVETPFGRRDKALFTVILETGLHLSEAVKLRLKDVADWQAPVLAASPIAAAGDGALNADNQEAQEGAHSKESSARTALHRMRRAAWEGVREYLEHDGRLAEMKPDDFIFTPLKDIAGKLAQQNPQGWEGKPFSARGAWEALSQYAAWAGLEPERVTPEALRTTGARRLVEAGAGTEEVAAFLRMKKPDRVRHLMRRLKAGGQSPESATREAWGPGEADDPDPSPAGRLQRKRPGAQPGNLYRLKHGLYAARYNLGQLGIHHHSLKDVDLENLPAILAELKGMQLEVFELPDQSIDVMLKKLRKVSYMATIYGRLVLAAAKILREAEEREELEGLEKFLDFSDS